MTIEAMKQALEAAYLAGFRASAEGYNNEYPFSNHRPPPELDAQWLEKRANYVSQATEQAEQEEPVAWIFNANGHTRFALSEPPDDAYDEGTLYSLYTAPPQRQPQ